MPRRSKGYRMFRVRREDTCHVLWNKHKKWRGIFFFQEYFSFLDFSCLRFNKERRNLTGWGNIVVCWSNIPFFFLFHYIFILILFQSCIVKTSLFKCHEREGKFSFNPPGYHGPLVSDFIHRVARAQPEEGCDLSTIFLHSIANDDIEGGFLVNEGASFYKLGQKFTFIVKFDILSPHYSFPIDIISLNKVILINLIHLIYSIS